MKITTKEKEKQVNGLARRTHPKALNIRSDRRGEVSLIYQASLAGFVSPVKGKPLLQPKEALFKKFIATFVGSHNGAAGNVE